MKTCTCKIWLNKGHSATRRDVTPAEAAMYIAEHHRNVGSNPIEVLKEGDDVERSAAQEKARLVRRFGKAKVNALFPGASPNLPEDFKECLEIGLAAAMPESEFVNGTPPAAPAEGEVKAPASTGDE